MDGIQVLETAAHKVIQCFQVAGDGEALVPTDKWFRVQPHRRLVKFRLAVELGPAKLSSPAGNHPIVRFHPFPSLVRPHIAGEALSILGEALI